jgi:hypothetical protein
VTITIREEQDAGNNTSQITFTLGAGTLTTDTLVLFHSDNFYTAADLLTPTGTAASTWTLRLTRDNGTNEHHIKVWTAPVTTGGASTVVTNSTNVDNERYAAVFVLQSSPEFDTAAGAGDTSGSPNYVAPSVTPTAGKTDDLLLCGWATGLTTFSMPGGMTAYTERDVGGAASYIVASEQLVSDAATGTRTATGGTLHWAAASLLMKTTAPPPPAPNLFVTRSNLQLR